jgi:hypothetical protein
MRDTGVVGVIDAAETRGYPSPVFNGHADIEEYK